ncbi:hypothetical protein Vadar_031086 [Vaccinium darrowii]|uniref:Uncharacterized protein n=1 Tax=Vaccinium darrowii TaxID=229202 RepID=A0ACB7XW88_9ERIC|nr:hypothetical protein Vadar_031086 [Vaccinium darrowii]
MANLITLFIDNLADKVDPFCLRKKFTNFGVVRDVFIPNKRRKNSRRRFGFVRFDCPVSADVAIEKANGSRFMDNTIFVKRAAFNKNGVENVVKDPDLKLNNKDFHKPLFLDSHGGYLREKTFATVVSGKRTLEPNRFIIKA